MVVEATGTRSILLDTRCTAGPKWEVRTVLVGTDIICSDVRSCMLVSESSVTMSE